MPPLPSDDAPLRAASFIRRVRPCVCVCEYSYSPLLCPLLCCSRCTVNSPGKPSSRSAYSCYSSREARGGEGGTAGCCGQPAHDALVILNPRQTRCTHARPSSARLRWWSDSTAAEEAEQQQQQQRRLSLSTPLAPPPRAGARGGGRRRSRESPPPVARACRFFFVFIPRGRGGALRTTPVLLGTVFLMHPVSTKN